MSVINRIRVFLLGYLFWTALGGLTAAEAQTSRAECKPLSLYCMELVPTAAYVGVKASLELARPASAFGVAVSRDGHQRYDLVAHVEGLPAAPQGSVYIAWVMPLDLDPVVHLGRIDNGATNLGEVAFNKFMVLVSLEDSPLATERKGPLVLRGRSPSSRLEPHDLFQVSAFADPQQGGGRAHGAPGQNGHDHAGGDGADAAWPMPAMHPGVRMSRAMHTLVPDVAPWIPETELAPQGNVAALPEARPRETLYLNDGDTLTLHAYPVRKRVGGRAWAMLGYNGQIPGPLLHVEKYVTIKVTFKNDAPFASSIHWHGLRHDNRFDGVPGLTQDPVPPGGTFEYEVHFPDAGLYWYHPHHREEVQQDLGLYGNMIVRPPAFEALPFVSTEEILVLDDLTVAPTGNVPYGSDATNYMLMGRFGNVPLINGEERVELHVARFDTLRLFVTNVSNTRTWNMSVEGHALQVMGSDLGLYSDPVWEESMAIAPAERYTADLVFPRAGRYAITNRVQSLDHTAGVFFPEIDTLGWIVVDSAEVNRWASKGPTPRPRMDPMVEYTRFRRALARTASLGPDSLYVPDREIELFIRADSVPPLVNWLLNADQSWFQPVEWTGTMPMMNWSATGRQVDWVIREPTTGRENMDIDWTFERGTTEIIRIVNRRDSPHAMQHPIHLHGQRFLVLSYNGRPVQHQVWKDTVLIPAGMTADIAVEFTNPGKWMLHCHIAEHLEGGMKMAFEVE